jgi:catechol 2,3-dioxygenase-like lactoylglutathione lyase family enzyme
MQPTDLRLVQIASSCRDLLATRSWYAECFGYLPAAGGFDSETYPESIEIAGLQGVPGASMQVIWAVDQQEFFQLEFFQYRAPEARPLPADWRPCDIGYTTIGLHVADLDAALRRLAESGTEPLTPPLEVSGARRVCVRDPDGVLLELMEDDPRVTGDGPRPRPGVPVAARMVRASVPDLARSVAYFVDTVGMRRHEPTLHGLEHERLWGLEGAKRRVELLSAGDLWLELAEYEDPRPAPWPDGYRISDLGILNIALGTRDKEVFRATKEAVESAGYRVNPGNDVGFGAFVYTMDDQGFSVEFMYLDESADTRAGFTPEEPQPA